MVPEVDTPRRYIGLMVLGVVLGLVVGLAIGVAWHLVRSARGRRRRRLAEGRLADAQAALAEQAVQLRAASDAAAAAETARAVARRRARHSCRGRRTRRRRTPRRSGPGWRGRSPSCRPQALAKNNEQFLTLADTRLNEARTAAQGDLDQRQQAIARLLDPLSETLARYERGLQEMELERKGAYEGLTEKVAAAASRARAAAQGDPQPGDRAAVAADARALGRDPAAPRWPRWPACSSTATSTSRSRRRPTRAGCGPT